VAAVSTPAFWDDLYARGGDGWDLRGTSTPLVDFMETTPPPPGRVAVPGCGRGHDARYLASRGYEVTGFDFSTAAVREARALAEGASVTLTYVQRDIFSLAHDHGHAFDGVWEYTCYCAIDPARRADYVEILAAIIKPGGWLLACFYPIRQGGGGPPFPVARAEVRHLLGRGFRIERAASPPRSAVGRQGQEWIVYARRTGEPA
jgi:SAM-dependent methyltransferase